MLKLGKASAVLRVYRARFILPFRPLLSPSLDIVSTARTHLVHAVETPVQPLALPVILLILGDIAGRFLTDASAHAAACALSDDSRLVME